MKSKLSCLNNTVFIICLIILLANDFYLKYEYHNWLTGKLSDFCGLFVFASFLMAILPHWKKTVCVSTALSFIIWKTPYSQPLIDFFSAHFYTIERIVDTGDLLALLVLPLAYLNHQTKHIGVNSNPIPVAILSMFAFMATSVPRASQSFEQPQYVLFKSGALEIEDAGYASDIQTYRFDSVTIIAIRNIEIEKFPPRNDDFHKIQILSDLDIRLLPLLQRTIPGRTDSSIHKTLPDSLLITGSTAITLNLDSVTDDLNFKGTRLAGTFTRYSDKKQKLIEGHYKNGIEDSTWNFYNGREELILRKHFHAGELTTIDRFQDSTLISTTHVNTRKETIIRQYLLLGLISVFAIGFAAALILNFRRAGKEGVIRLTTFSKIVQILFLPTIIFVLAKVISSFISAFKLDIFKIAGEFIVVEILLTLLLVAVFYVLKLRSRYDILLYALLFTLSIIWIEEFLYLRALAL